MRSGQTLHAEAVRYYQERGWFSQKDIMSRNGYKSIRSVQRMRKAYGLRPVSFWGNNPLFSLTDIVRVEKMIAKERERKVKAICANARRAKLPNYKTAKRAAKGRK